VKKLSYGELRSRGIEMKVWVITHYDRIVEETVIDHIASTELWAKEWLSDKLHAEFDLFQRGPKQYLETLAKQRVFKETNPGIIELVTNAGFTVHGFNDDRNIREWQFRANMTYEEYINRASWDSRYSPSYTIQGYEVDE
jgi:hypothetical protein